MTKKELTKEKIRAAAYKCVARFGFEKTTLDDIAKEVGLNKASLYYYYKNKEDIFLEITTDATRRFLETLKTSTLQIGTGIEAQVRHFLIERTAYYLKMTADIHISEEALRQVEHLFYEQIKDVEAQEIQFLAERLDAAAIAGHFQKTDTKRLARNLILLSEGIKRSVKERHTDARDTTPMVAEIAENLDFMLGLVWAGLRGF
jgi:TetR/AcrR family transcriptional regulator, biofilm operon repressor